MILLKLFIEFFLVGLFAVGGGLATIPFLTNMATRSGWFSLGQLTNMIAVSESTPGPLGVNMASYVGFTTAGFPGAVAATLGLIAPCIVIILIIAAILKKFRNNQHIEALFYGLRPASTGLIAASGWAVITLSLVQLSNPFQSSFSLSVNWPCLVLAAAILFFTHFKFTKKLHPVLWIALSALVGFIFML